MRIVDNKALVVKTRRPHIIVENITKSAVVGKTNDVFEVAVHWGIDEAQKLTALNIGGVPSPIGKDYKWTGKFTPFDHQRETSSFLSLRKRAFCFSEAGTGKTASVIWAADYLMQQKQVKRILVVCPLSIMKAAWQQDLFKFAMHRSCVVAHGTAESRKKAIATGAEFVIINFDGVGVVEKEIIEAKFDMIVIDECFVAGTLVDTPKGPVGIETLCVGDEVLTSNGVAPIRRVTNKPATHLVRIRTSDGKDITCTPEHPFFTDAGWVTAEHTEGRRLVSLVDLCNMRDPLPHTRLQIPMAPQEGFPNGACLLTILRSEEVPLAKSGGQLLQPYPERTAGGFPCTEVPRGARKNIPDAKSERPSPLYTRGQRDWSYPDGSISARMLRSTMGMELRSVIGEQAGRLSYELQTGLRMALQEDRVRSGWGEPQCEEPTGPRPEKRSETSGVWVVSVSRVECERPVPVYNLEVEGTPNYFVGGGALVHNCNAYKNASTNRWKIMARIAYGVEWLWLMTGTPAAQSPVDAYGLAKLAVPHMVSPYIGQFRDKVLYKVSQFVWKPKFNADKIVHAVLQPAIRFEKKNCLDLPLVTHVDREAPLTPQQMKFYKILKSKMMIEAAGESVTSVNAAVNLNKLMQVACGSVYSDDGDVVEFDVSNRLNAVLEVVEEASNKVLIFVPFTHTIHRLKEFLAKHKITSEIIDGSVSLNTRSQHIADFQNKPDPKVLIIQPQAASHGLTLTAADTIIWYAPTPSVETYLQANARIDRPGQHNPMTIVHIHGSDIEEHLYKMLRSNIDNHNKIVDLYREVMKSTP